MSQPSDKAKEELEKMYLSAAQYGTLEKVKEAIRNHVDIHAKDRWDHTALYHAATRHDPESVEIIKFLISEGLNKETQSKEGGHTPLMSAAISGNLETVKTLIELGCNLKAKSKYHYTILMEAILHDHLDIANYLLQFKETDIHEQDDRGYTTLGIATHFGRDPSIHFLLKKGAYIDSLDKEGKTIFEEIDNVRWHGEEYKATIKVIIKSAMELVEIAATPRSESGVFSREINEDIFTILGTSLNARRIQDGNTALHLAIINGNTPLIIKLLEKGADPNIPNHDGVTPLVLLESQNPSFYIKILLRLSKVRTSLEDYPSRRYRKEEEKESKEEVLEKKKKIEIEEKALKEMSEMLNSLSHATAIVNHKFSLIIFELLTNTRFTTGKAKKAKQSIQEELIQKLLNNVRKEDFPFKAIKEKTAHSILRQVSSKISPLFNKKIIEEIFQMMKLEYKEDKKEAGIIVANNFKNEQIIFTLHLSDDVSVVGYRCQIRIPPITLDAFLDVDPKGYRTANTLKPHQWDEPWITHQSIESAICHLLTIARNEVARQRAEFTQKEQAKDLVRKEELKVTADRRESSMRGLLGYQNEALEAIRKKYHEKLEKMGGVDGVIKNYIEYLESEYNKNPIKYKEKTFELKPDPDVLKEMIKNQEDSDALKSLYYMNPIHTAWRYFLPFNPWLNPDAPYAVKESGVAICADITEQARKDLAYLWLAASDNTITPIRNMSVADMMNLFTEEISNLNRAHNWDTLDAIAEGPEKRKVTEDMVKKHGKIVDDLKPDNPSCNMGVNQRLMQAVLGNPITETLDTRALDPKIAKDYITDMITTRFNEYLLKKDYDDLKKLKELFNKKYIDMEPFSKPEQELYDEFRLSKEDMLKVIMEMQELFGERMQFIEIQVSPGEHYTCYEEYIRKLMLQNPFETFYERLSGILENALKPKDTKHEKDGKGKKEITHHYKTKDLPKNLDEKDEKERKNKEPKSPKGRGGTA